MTISDTASADLTPGQVFTDPKFPWSDYLQRHLTTAGVVVSRLHPIMGLRVAALFIDLTKAGFADDTPGRGTFQILSGVRSKAHQTALWNEICGRQRRCGYVANPNTVHAVDAEGVQRQGSNHMAQRQPWPAAIQPRDVGYAIDLRNQRGSNDAAWQPVHSRLATYGLDWPLKTGAVERWHIEAFPRRNADWIDGPWPARPGVHRPIMRPLRGGDVKAYQQARGLKADGIAGRLTEADIRKRQTELGRPVTGIWVEVDQMAAESDAAPKPDAPGFTFELPINPTTNAARISALEKIVYGRGV